MPAYLSAYSYPIEGPRWSVVDAAQLSNEPYKQICRITAYFSGEIIKMGTGWLCKDGVIATAGHVLFGADECEIQWASSVNSTRVNTFELHPQFALQRVGSDVDLAKITGVPSPNSPLEASEVTPEIVAALGFQFGDLVEHSGSTVYVQQYIGHRADTDQGHSGGPILNGNRVVGLHLGTSPITRRFLPHELRQNLITNNCGVLISAPACQFLFN